MKSVYAPKEQQLLDAAIAIIDEGGTPLHSLKVADIAARAGIGKGTVYEYFDSKEELICEALCYRTRSSLDAEWTAIRGESDFKKGFFHALAYVRKQAKPSVMNLEWLQLSNVGLLEAALKEMRALFNARMKTFYGELIARGVSEGVFPPPSPDYAAFVLTSIFCGFDFLLRMGEENSGDAYMESAYRMLIKALQ